MITTISTRQHPSPYRHPSLHQTSHMFLCDPLQWLQCCYSVVTLLLQCCYSAVTVFWHGSTRREKRLSLIDRCFSYFLAWRWRRRPDKAFYLRYSCIRQSSITAIIITLSINYSINKSIYLSFSLLLSWSIHQSVIIIIVVVVVIFLLLSPIIPPLFFFRFLLFFFYCLLPILSCFLCEGKKSECS